MYTYKHIIIVGMLGSSSRSTHTQTSTVQPFSVKALAFSARAGFTLELRSRLRGARYKSTGHQQHLHLFERRERRKRAQRRVGQAGVLRTGTL